MAGALEVRQDHNRPMLRGTFPYDDMAVVASSGRVRKERFRPGAFAFSIREALAGRARIDVLAGHDYGKPLASTETKTLDFEDTAAALTFEAALPEDGAATFMDCRSADGDPGRAAYRHFPRFQHSPAALAGAFDLTPEPGNADVLIRSIREAVLYEMSAVTRPSYQNTDVDLRAWRRAAGVADGERKARLWL